MINEHRRKQLLDLMTERGWGSILLYGNAWRKDPFRSLVNFNFSGDHALARLSRSGEVSATFSDPWDAENASAKLEPDFVRAFTGGASAIAGLEFMEERFVAACGALPVSATADVEELRRVKTAEEIGYIKQACDLADRGYQRFVEVAEPGMREFELVAEVEAFLKENGAEDNFMLIASGGTEVVGMKPPTERKFQKGDSVTTELTPQVNGYYAQICRTLVLGEPSQGQLQFLRDFFRSAKGRRGSDQAGGHRCGRRSRAERRIPQTSLSANIPPQSSRVCAGTAWGCIRTKRRISWKTWITS